MSFSEATLAGRVGSALRRNVAANLLGGGLPDSAPRVLATIAVRIREIEMATSAGAVAGLRALAQIVPLALALIFVSPRLAIGGVLLLLPLGLILSALRRRWRRASTRAQTLVEELHAGVDELVAGIDLWRTYGAGQRVAQAIESAGERATRAQARVDAVRAALSGANEVMAALALLGGVAIAKSANLSLGDGTLIAFAAIFFMAYRPLRDLGDSRSWRLRGEIALEALDRIGAGERVRSIATNDDERREFPLAALELDAFGASARGPRLSFALQPGTIACLLGPTGSGKTTILRALLGLEPAAGSLRYGGQQLARAAVGPASRPFAWVPQDAALVTGTILENVALCSGDERGARDALETLAATGLLERAGDRVGPGGRALSGGERRLVAIARALASGAPVLLLDEPTEGLDPDAEAQVLAALCRLRDQRSLIVVSHRPSVAAIADQRVVIARSDAAEPLAAQ